MPPAQRLSPHAPVRAALLAVLASVLTALPEAPAAAAPADLVPPASITVCRDAYGGGAVEDVAFKEYVKTVLPYEFDSSLGGGYREYYRAGAVAISSYAWFFVDRGKRAGGGTCHVYDDGRHQHYNPDQARDRRTAVTDRAVEETWHWRMEEDGHPAFAQYCSRSCGQFPEGRHLDQVQARQQALDGLDHVAILGHAYRAMRNFRLLDWRGGFGVDLVGAEPYAVDPDEPFGARAVIVGVHPGDTRATVTLHAQCTIEGRDGSHPLQAVHPIDGGDGRAVAVFEAADGVKACEQEQASVVAVLAVNGYPLAADAALAWRPWTSASPREVQRVARTADPSHASILLSQGLFADRQAAQEAAGDGLDGLLGGQQGAASDGGAQARAVVLARADVFADSLAATGLAGSDAPILLTPGGRDARLREDVRGEIDRVLDPGDTVHLVGGEAALSAAIADELREAGYLVERHGGATRIETSLRVAEAVRAAGGDSSTVLLARAWPDTSEGWADAVASGPYAAAARHPVLVTRDDRLADQIEAWVEDPANEVGEVVLLGGPAAVPADAEERLDVATVRVAGPTRGHTAAAIANLLWAREDAPEVQGAMLVDGYDDGDWPFALAASVQAARHGMPQLLTRRLVPHHSTGAWLDEREGLDVVVVGDGSVVAPRVDGDVAGPDG